MALIQVVVIGGGAAGYFAAINCAQQHPHCRVILLEKTQRTLDKVRISGGGRCNVTHAVWTARELAKNYPRGGRELLSVFSRFQPSDTIGWFEQRGVALKTEADGRMFPVSNSSQTIIDCLSTAAQQAGVQLLYHCGVEQLIPSSDSIPHWLVCTQNGTQLPADRIMIATGSNPAMWRMLAQIGYAIVPPVPSLFTFKINDPLLTDLSGVSVALVSAALPPAKLRTEGALLVTHWGLSGPAILKLSAWAARYLAEQGYRCTLHLNWTHSYTTAECYDYLTELRTDPQSYRKQISNYPLFELPNRLWQRLISATQLPPQLRWADASNKQLNALAQHLTDTMLQVQGKSTFKDEFVTCGGVALSQVNFKTMESKLHKGLFFGGEVLDIDAVTGGFNFQAAWSTAWVAAQAMGSSNV